MIDVDGLADRLTAANLRAETFERQYRQACADHAVMRHERDEARTEMERLRTALGDCVTALDSLGDDATEIHVRARLNARTVLNYEQRADPDPGLPTHEDVRGILRDDEKA